MVSKYKPVVIGTKYIDASDHVLGRLASKVAKLALMGYEIHIVNTEKTVITGKKEFVLSYLKHKILERGDWYKGPFYPKRPDKVVKRVVRGMLPKNWRGRVALKRIKTYVGVPDELKDKDFDKFKDALVNEKIRKTKRKIWYVYLEDVVKYISAKIRT